MEPIEPYTDCPACFGRGHLCLLDAERPEDFPCERCGTTGKVTLAEAARQRVEARAFVAEALRRAGVHPDSGR